MSNKLSVIAESPGLFHFFQFKDQVLKQHASMLSLDYFFQVLFLPPSVRREVKGLSELLLLLYLLMLLLLRHFSDVLKFKLSI